MRPRFKYYDVVFQKIIIPTREHINNQANRSMMPSASSETLPLISVIVPVYNAASFLSRCMDSLVHQTYSNLEIICVNDGSKDNSADILDEYAARDSRVKVIHQENKGVSVARNTGMDAATGEFVSFVDADDWIELNTYNRIAENIADDIDVVWFGIQLEGDIAPNVCRLFESFLEIPLEGRGQIPMSMIVRSDGSMCNKVVRRKLIEEYECRFPLGIAYGEDAVIRNCVLAVAREIYFIPDKLYHYMQWNESATKCEKKMKNHCLDQLNAVACTVSFFKKYDMLHKKGYMLHCFLHMAYLFALKGSAELQNEAHCKAYKLAQNIGFLKCKHWWSVRDILSKRIGRVEHFFHRYEGNCEKFGIGKITLLSITYEEQWYIWRVVGCKLFALRVN